MAVKLKEYKSLSEHRPIEKMPASAKVYIPLSQHLGKPCAALVKPGDYVFIGQKIGWAEAKIFAPIHSSVSGKAAGVQNYPHPVLGQAQAIVIENDFKDNAVTGLCACPLEQIDKLTVEQIRNIVFEAGIVGMGGAGFPAHIKLTPPKPIHTMILNGAECEPYLTSDYRLMVEKTEEILKGINLVSRCLGAKEVIIAIEDNKPRAIEKFRIHCPEFTIKVLKSQYPQGGEKQLIKSVLNKEVPAGKLPFDIGVSVNNAGTVFAVYQAVYLNKPLYERVVTVTGSCVSNPKNLLARIGTPIQELISFCGPLKEEPAKIICGGPMMGVAQYTGQSPVIKSTAGIVLMNKQEVKTCDEQSCIRCGACVRNCPVGLVPALINLVSQKENWKEAEFYGASDCIECGICGYLCPANINLVQAIRRAKGAVK